jgi:thiamine-monophosphate kinase
VPCLSEFELIKQLFAPLAKDAPGALGVKDDAALIALPMGHELVVTTDALVEGVHFRACDPPDLVARKALRVNLSDLAAKGAEPLGYLLALALPATRRLDWLEAFASGFAEDQRQFRISLLGGDTTATPGPLTLAITALGSLPTGQMIKRSGAKAGDHIFVSGTIGDSGAGLGILSEEIPRANPHKEYLAQRYLLPQPRMALGVGLRGIASAALDVSDGLLADLGHIAETSGVRIEMDAAHIPLSDAYRAIHGADAVSVVRATTSGDDYEIAFTVPEDRIEAARVAAQSAQTRITEIGRVCEGNGVVLRDRNGNEIDVLRKGYTHFSR